MFLSVHKKEKLLYYNPECDLEFLIFVVFEKKENQESQGYNLNLQSVCENCFSLFLANWEFRTVRSTTTTAGAG